MMSKVLIASWAKGVAAHYIAPGHQFNQVLYERMQSWCTALSWPELDMQLIGQIMSSTNTRELTVHSIFHQHKEQEQARSK